MNVRKAMPQPAIAQGLLGQAQNGDDGLFAKLQGVTVQRIHRDHASRAERTSDSILLYRDGTLSDHFQKDIVSIPPDISTSGRRQDLMRHVYVANGQITELPARNLAASRE